MRIQSTQRVPLVSARTVVSAYIDGKSTHIEGLKLDAVDRFEKVYEEGRGEIGVTIDGLRHSPRKDYLTFAALGALPTAAAAAAGYQVAGLPGAALGALGGLAVAGLPAGYFLHRAVKAPQWKPEHRLQLGEGSQASPVSHPGAERLRSLVDENRRGAPEARQILFLSGHGDRKEVAHMPIPEMGQAMRGSALDATIIDACLLGQLEVLTHLAPWAGLVMVSPHKIKARGLELPKMLQRDTLSKENFQEAVTDMAAQAKSTTPSFAVIDTLKFQENLLPALDKLGKKLSSSAPHSLRKVLAKSIGTDGLLSRRVDMGSFLRELESSELSSPEAEQALEAFQETVPFQKNKHSFSFHLKAGREEQSLPQGWRDFLKTADRTYKPLF